MRICIHPESSIVPGEQITEDVIIFGNVWQLGFSIEGLEVDKQIKVWINE